MEARPRTAYLMRQGGIDNHARMVPPMIRDLTEDRPESLLEPMESRRAIVRHLPNRRALEVLAQMYGYYENQSSDHVVIDDSYDAAA